MSVQQLTLELEETDEPRQRPDTMRWCQHCCEHVLRSRWFDHEAHDAEARKEFERKELTPDDEEEEKEPETIGAWYDIELSYRVDFRFRVPAWDEHRAEELAKEWVEYPSNCADMFHMHTRRDERKEITTADVPDDFDPYGNTELWEVFDE